ncbi:MAG: hypothetical protein ACK58T_20870 [Phycisphaerae bacterium]|jgi:hypothetical protein
MANPQVPWLLMRPEDQALQMQKMALAGTGLEDTSINQMAAQAAPIPKPQTVPKDMVVPPKKVAQLDIPMNVGEQRSLASAQQTSAIPAAPPSLWDQSADLRSKFQQMQEDRLAKEEAGIADYDREIQKLETQKRDIDWRPLAALVDQWAGGGNTLKVADALAPESKEAKNQRLLAMKQTLQGMKSGLSKSQLDALKDQLASVNSEITAKSAAERIKNAAEGKDSRGERNDRTDESKFRNEWLKNPITKNSQDVGIAYQKVASAVQDPSAAGDLSLIFGYMKMLDPASTVREGEFANASNAGGVGDKIINIYERVRSGERLTPGQRADFVNQAKKVYESQMLQQKKFDESMAKVAGSYGYDPSRVVLSETLKADIPNAPAGGSDLAAAAAAEIARRKAATK